MAKHGAQKEKVLLPKVQATVFTSQGLLDQKKSATPQGFLIKNGVNYVLFHQGFRERSPSKIVGYVGSVDFRTSFQLLTEVIGRCPNFKFHFVGPVESPEQCKFLEAIPNVKLLGSRAAEKWYTREK